ncbi:MAG: glycine oxidase ThiO [Candidatus Acidiferrales bacterium]
MSAFDVIVVGGGVIGGSIAFELASEKLRVALLDRQDPGREASWAAAGMLSPGPDSPDALPLVPLGKESLRLYPQFIAAIEETSGQRTDFAREGTFEIFPGPRGEAARDELLEEYRRLKLRAEALPSEAARVQEPSLGQNAGKVAWLPEEATLDPRLLVESILAAAKRRGAEIRAGCAVDAVLYEGGSCAGVIARGEKIASKLVVVAAGSFCGMIEDAAPAPNRELRHFAPVHPVRGQMLALRSRAVKLKRVLRSQHAYLVPRRDGRIVAGSTLEDAGFAKQVTPQGIRRILDAVFELAPGLADAEIVEEWAGLRPDTPDHLPIIGPTGTEGLWVATGHYRNGILLAPVTAKIVRDWIVTGKPNFDTGAFSPLRFAATTSRARANRNASGA